MKKRDVIEELISKELLVSTKHNRLRMLGSVSMSMYGGSSWPLTIQTLAKKKGKRYVFKLGHSMGTESAKELVAVIKRKKLFLPKSVFLVDNLIQAAGFGVVTVTSFVPKNIVILESTEHVMLDMAHDMYGARSQVGHFYAGVFSGFVEVLLRVSTCKLKFERTVVGGKRKYVFKCRK